MNGIKIEEVPLKKCSNCGKEKNINCFYKHRSSKNGIRSICKICSDKEHEKFVKSNVEKMREWDKKYRHERRKTHPVESRKYSKKYSKTHPVEVKAQKKRWIENNPDKVKAIRKRRDAKIRSTLKGKLSRNMSVRIYNYLRNGSKAGRKWELLVGFTADQLKTHLEKQFKDGMNWENYGKHGWHVDHKIPLAAFNFLSPEDIDFKKAWALSNLQPLWARENIQKSNKLEMPFQPSLCINA